MFDTLVFSWQFLIFVSIILYAVSTLLQRVLLKDEQSDSKAFAIFFQILTGVIIGGFGVALHSTTLPNMRPIIWNFVLMVILYGGASIFNYSALKHIEVSRYTIIFSLRAIFTVIISTLFLHESLSLRQVIGSVFILAAIVLTNIRGAKLHFTKYELFALIAALGAGIAVTNDRYLLHSFEVFPYVTLAFILPGLFIASVFPRTIKHMRIFLRLSFLKQMILICVIFAASAVAFYLALQRTSNASQVVMVNLSSVVITVLLAIIFLKERDHIPQKIVAAILTFIGLVLVG